MGNLVRGISLGADREYQGTFLDLLNPYSLFFGLTTVLLFAMHGAIYVSMKTDGEVQSIVRSWIPRLIGVFLAFYFIFNLYTIVDVEWVLNSVRSRPWVFAVVSVNILIVLNIPREISKGREFRAFLSSCVGMCLMMATFGLTYFPYMVRSNPILENSLTIYNASSSPKTLGIMLIIAAVGVPIVLAYTASIYWIFRGKTTLTKHSY